MNVTIYTSFENINMESILCKVFRLSNTTNRYCKNYLSCNLSNIFRVTYLTLAIWKSVCQTSVWQWANHSFRNSFIGSWIFPQTVKHFSYRRRWSSGRIRWCPVFDSRVSRSFSQGAIPEHGEPSRCRPEFES